MANGSVSRAERERLTSKSLRGQYLGTAFSGLRESMGLAERVALAAEQSRQRQLASACMTGDELELPLLAAGRAVKALACTGRRPSQVTISLTCPTELTEAQLRERMRVLAETELTFAQVELRRESVPHVIAHAVATGDLREETGICPESSAETSICTEEVTEATDESIDLQNEAYHIVMCGAAGEEGTILLYNRHREELESRYPKHFLREIPTYAKDAWRAEAVEAGWLGGAEYQLACGDGGAFAGLWELGEQLRCGMVIDVPSIPIRQQTIEVCELLDRNPYLLASGNVVLMVTRRPEQLLNTLWQQGYEAEDIGTLQTAAARELRNGDELRFVEPYRGAEGIEE